MALPPHEPASCLHIVVHKPFLHHAVQQDNHLHPGQGEHHIHQQRHRWSPMISGRAANPRCQFKFQLAAFKGRGLCWHAKTISIEHFKPLFLNEIRSKNKQLNRQSLHAKLDQPKPLTHWPPNGTTLSNLEPLQLNPAFNLQDTWQGLQACSECSKQHSKHRDAQRPRLFFQTTESLETMKQSAKSRSQTHRTFISQGIFCKQDTDSCTSLVRPDFLPNPPLPLPLFTALSESVK